MSHDVVDLAVGEHTFRTRVAGPESGELVILLHGYPQSSWEWHHQLPALAAAGYRAVAPDQRGYSPGARPEGVEHYDITSLVGDVLAIADELGGHRFHLVGHDWGAIVAWFVAGWHPGRLKSLTIVSVPHPVAFGQAIATSPDQAARSSYIAEFKEGREADMLGSPEKLRGAFEASGLAGHDVEEHVRVLSDPKALEAATHWYRAYGFEQGRELGSIEVPTLFVWGTDDPALGPDGVHRTGDFVQAPYRLEILEGAPHWIPEANAERFTELLLDHLASV